MFAAQEGRGSVFSPWKECRDSSREEKEDPVEIWGDFCRKAAKEKNMRQRGV